MLHIAPLIAGVSCNLFVKHFAQRTYTCSLNKHALPQLS